MDFDLEEKLESQDKHLFNCLQSIKEFCTKVWKDRQLAWFTNHNCDHSKEIVHILGQVLEPIKDNALFLNEHELFILLASAYLHDVGMQCLKRDAKAIETLTESDYNDIRKKHAEISFDIIVKRVANLVERDDFQLPNCIDEEYIPVIALVSKGHSSDFFEVVTEQFRADQRTPKGRPVRGEFITALLMISDELDLQCKRINFSDTAKFTLSPHSQMHWFKHHYVDFVEINRGQIRIILRFPKNSENYQNLIKSIIEVKLNEQIRRSNSMLKDATGGMLHLDEQIHFDFRTEETTTKRELPDTVLLEMKNVLKVNAAVDSQENARTIASNTYPKPSSIFTGREDELKRFEKTIGMASFISIEGLGGIGKTEFSAKCIDKYIPQDKVVWFECQPDSHLDAVIEMAGYPDVLKGENKTERAKFSGFRDLIERDAKVIFLDNFHDVLDSSFKEFFQMSKQYLKQAKIILISREHPSIGFQIAPVEIKGLQADALGYARKLIETFYSELIVDDEVLSKICTNVAGHPLAIDLALQLLHYGESPELIIQKIIEAPDKSTELSHRLLDEIFSHPQSTEKEKNLMLAFSVFRSDVEKKAIAFVADIEDIDLILRKLQDKKMITRSSTAYGTHPLVREFCYRNLTDKKATHGKAAEYFKSQRKDHFVPLLEEEYFHHLFVGEYFERAADLVCEIGGIFVRIGHTNLLKEMITKINSTSIDELVRSQTA